uniref:Uncharacterized protein n=1 Tax=Trichinella nativa TaxID=6335 RepID=A0A0V1KJD4_9BILA
MKRWRLWAGSSLSRVVSSFGKSKSDTSKLETKKTGGSWWVTSLSILEMICVGSNKIETPIHLHNGFGQMCINFFEACSRDDNEEAVDPMLGRSHSVTLGNFV